MMKLDWKKIERYAEDHKNLDWVAFRKKYGYNRFDARGVGRMCFQHILCTLKAHARGRIHARNIGKVCEYEDRVYRERGRGFYKLLSKRYRVTVDSLEEQAELLGADFLKKFESDSQSEAA